MLNQSSARMAFREAKRRAQTWARKCEWQKALPPNVDCERKNDQVASSSNKRHHKMCLHRTIRTVTLGSPQLQNLVREPYLSP